MWKTSNQIEVKRVLSSHLPLCVLENNHMVLVDTGRLKAMASMMGKIEKIAKDKIFELIILTHTHSDHMETLQPLVERFDLQVLVQENEKSAVEKLISTDRVITFDDVYRLTKFGLNGYVMATPGHSIGSTVSTDSLNSMKRLLALNCKAYVPSHKNCVYTHEELEMMLNVFASPERRESHAIHDDRKSF